MRLRAAQQGPTATEVLKFRLRPCRHVLETTVQNPSPVAQIVRPGECTVHSFENGRFEKTFVEVMVTVLRTQKTITP